MGYFQIKNITPELGKRHIKVNSTQYVDMKSNFAENRVAIAPGAEIFIESTHLPISVHKLRSEGLVSVVELDKNTYEKKRANAQSIQVVDNKSVEEEVDADSKQKRAIQKPSKKEN
jgi:hypothetical protein